MGKRNPDEIDKEGKERREHVLVHRHVRGAERMQDLRSGEWVFAMSTLVVPFLAGMLLFSKWVFRDIEVRWGLGFATQCVFAATLAVSFQTHAAVVGEVGGGGGRAVGAIVLGHHAADVVAAQQAVRARKEIPGPARHALQRGDWTALQ